MNTALEHMWASAAEKCAAFRALARLVKEDKFVTAYYKWDDDQRQQAAKAINDGDLGLIKAMISIQATQPEDMTVRQLHELGRQLRVPRYSRLNRIQLLERIKPLLKAKERTSNDQG